VGGRSGPRYTALSRRRPFARMILPHKRFPFRILPGFSMNTPSARKGLVVFPPFLPFELSASFLLRDLFGPRSSSLSFSFFVAFSLQPGFSSDLFFKGKDNRQCSQFYCLQTSFQAVPLLMLTTLLTRSTTPSFLC